MKSAMIKREIPAKRLEARTATPTVTPVKRGAKTSLLKVHAKEKKKAATIAKSAVSTYSCRIGTKRPKVATNISNAASATTRP